MRRNTAVAQRGPVGGGPRKSVVATTTVAVEEEWKRFQGRLARAQKFKDLVVEHAGVKKESVRFMEHVCRLTWDLCMADRVYLQERLDELNMASLKQVASMKAQLAKAAGVQMPGAPASEELVEFYDPLRFLGGETQELVLSIIKDKLVDLEMGRAPPALGGIPAAKAVLEHAAVAQSQRPAPVQQPTEDQVAALSTKLAEAEKNMDLAEQRAARLQGQVEKQEEELKEAKQRELVLKNEMGLLQTKCESLQTKCERLQYEKEALEERIEKYEVEVAKLKSEKERLIKDLERLKRDFQTALDRISALEKEAENATRELKTALSKLKVTTSHIESLKRELAQMEEQTKSLRDELARSEEKARNIEAECETLREQMQELAAAAEVSEERARQAEQERDRLAEILRLRDDTRVESTQTIMTSETIEETTAEIDRLRELVVSLAERRAPSRGSQTQEMPVITKSSPKCVHEDLSVCKPLIRTPSQRTIFERLYQDASAKTGRINKLRETHEEQQRAIIEASYSAAHIDLERQNLILERIMQEEEHRHQERQAQEQQQLSPQRTQRSSLARTFGGGSMFSSACSSCKTLPGVGPSSETTPHQNVSTMPRVSDRNFTTTATSSSPRMTLRTAREPHATGARDVLVPSPTLASTSGGIASAPTTFLNQHTGMTPRTAREMHANGASDALSLSPMRAPPNAGVASFWASDDGARQPERQAEGQVKSTSVLRPNWYRPVGALTYRSPAASSDGFNGSTHLPPLSQAKFLMELTT